MSKNILFQEAESKRNTDFLAPGTLVYESTLNTSQVLVPKKRPESQPSFFLGLRQVIFFFFLIPKLRTLWWACTCSLHGNEKRRRRNPGSAKPDALPLKPGHEDNSWMQHHWASVSPRSTHCIHKDWDLLLGNVRMGFVL